MNKRLFQFLLAAMALASASMVAGPAFAATPEEVIQQAQDADQQGSTQKAASLYEDFLKQHPDHSQVLEVRYRLGKCYDKLGKVNEAIASLVKVADGDPKFRSRAEALYSLGKLYASVTKNDEALATFEKLLSEGAGLYEDEVLSQAASYYAQQQKWDAAAAKLNILRRKEDRQVAQSSGYKLAMLWIKAQKMDSALAAIQEQAQQFPQDARLPELLLRVADAYRQQKRIDRTISLCEQLSANYPKTPEAVGAAYLLGISYRDRKEYQKAADALDRVGHTKELQARFVAAQALLASADLYFRELADTDKAMGRYEEAAKVARDCEDEGKNQVLEQCYFRLGERAFSQKKYSVALEYYTMLRATGTKVNVLSRMLACQNALEQAGASSPQAITEADVALLKQKIEANPGTSLAAEAEIFLLDRRFQEIARNRGDAAVLADEYGKLLAKYPKDVLAKDHLGSYVYGQLGAAYASGETIATQSKAIGAFEKGIELDPGDDNPYRQTALENIALVAERVGNKPKAAEAYGKLLAISKKQLEAGKDNKEAERKALDYMKSLVTRSDTPELVDSSIALARKTIEERGPLSDLSRESRFYLGELYYLKKDFSAAAKEYREFIAVYGPKQTDAGELVTAPWKPAKVDEKVEQVYEAAVRVAHCWYMQGHDQNMVKAYQWIVNNVPVGNRYVAEAQYWLAMELGKGEAGKSKDGKKKQAEALWLSVVNSTLDFTSPKFAKSYHPWVGGDDDIQKYVKNSILRAGQLFGEIEDHESAAQVFAAYLNLYPPAGGKEGGGRRPKSADRAFPAQREDSYDIARYAMGREYIALGNTARVIETYKAYLNGNRDDRFRVPGLRLLGYHAGKAEQFDTAVEAYAALLDEYTTTAADPKAVPVRVPSKDRLRQGNTGWDGLRMAAPKDLDLGDIRFSLGYLYWRREDWKRCAMALGPFDADASLADSKSRPKALYMAAQSYYNQLEYVSGVKMLGTLLRDHPKFEAIEEAYVLAARGYFETRNWVSLDLTTRNFIAEWPKSDRRSRIDLYAALSELNQGRGAADRIKAIAQSDTYEDVKADAYFQLAMQTQAAGPAALESALGYFDKSITTYARETSCLEAAKCAIKLKKWDKAMDWLDRAKREFPKADPRVIAEARDLSPQVQKELAKHK